MFVEPPTPSTAPANYERRAFLSGELETRVANWHDLFNALVWLTFPLAKAAINAGHCRAMSDESPERGRGAVRDALTLLDENGVIVVSDDPSLLDLLRGFAWKELFWHRRLDVIAHMRFYPFGHGLCAQALRPFIGLTGKAVLFDVDQEFMPASIGAQLYALDERLAKLVVSELDHPRQLAPLPLLGIPGYTQDNEQESYYEDQDYFRPGRRVSA